MINRFQKYLEIVDTKLSHMFENQSPFIKCKKGCSYCCKNGEFPLSELEYINLMLFFRTLSSDIQGIVSNNIEHVLLKNRQKYYECPFLINNCCSVYQARPLICRTFGLISYRGSDKKKIPYCVEFGLNYADVYDKKSGMLIKCAEDGTEPKAYNIDRRTLRNKEMEELFDIYFGEDKALIEWLKEDESFIQ